MRYTLNFAHYDAASVAQPPGCDLANGLIAFRLPESLVRWNQVNAGTRTVRIWLKSCQARRCVGFGVENDNMENINTAAISLEDGIDMDLNRGPDNQGINFSQIISTALSAHEGASDQEGTTLTTNAVLSSSTQPLFVQSSVGPQFGIETYLPQGMWLRVRVRTVLPPRTAVGTIINWWANPFGYFNFTIASNNNPLYEAPAYNVHMSLVIDVD